MRVILILECFMRNNIKTTENQLISGKGACSLKNRSPSPSRHKILVKQTRKPEPSKMAEPYAQYGGEIVGKVNGTLGYGRDGLGFTLNLNQEAIYILGPQIDNYMSRRAAAG